MSNSPDERPLGIPDVYERDSPDGPELVIINLKAKPFRTDLPLACLFHVRVLALDPQAPTRLSPVESAILDGCHELMTHYLEERNPGLFVARATNPVWRTTCFCMEPDVPQPDALLVELQRRYPDRQVTMEYYTDPDWSIYGRFYPTPLQMGQIMDNKILYGFHQRGVDMTLARPVNHSAEFPSEAAALSFVQTIEPQGFCVEQMEEDGAVWEVEFERSEILGSADLKPLLEWLRMTAMHFGGEHLGWGAGFSPDEMA